LRFVKSEIHPASTQIPRGEYQQTLSVLFVGDRFLSPAVTQPRSEELAMTHVVINAKRIGSPAGHHRQPRSGPTSSTLIGGASTEATPGSVVHATAAELEGLRFVFWSASDGIGGAVATTSSIDQQVGDSPLTLTAWYYPVGGDGGPGEAGYLIDAFSATLNDFVDDDFVTVTSDPSLTATANVAGWVPTKQAQQLTAYGSIHGGQVFQTWVGDAPATGATASLARGASGLAIATYRAQQIAIPRLDIDKRQGWLIFGGIGVDGGGFVIPIGGGPGGGPVGSWGPFVERVGHLLQVGVHSSRLGKDGLRLQHLALEQLQVATKEQFGVIEG